MPTPPARSKARPRAAKSRKLKELPLRLEEGLEWLEPLLLLMVNRPRSYIGTADAAKFIGCSISQVITAIQTGALDAHHNGLTPSGNGHWQVHPSSLLRFVWQRRGCKAEQGTAPNAAYLLCHALAHSLSRPGKAALRQLLDLLMERDDRAAKALTLSAPDPRAESLLLQEGARQSGATQTTSRTPQPTQRELI